MQNLISKTYQKPFKTIFQQQRFNFSIQQKFDPRIDYYNILGLSPTSTNQEIKSTYYKLAKQYHPDVYKGSDHDKFKKISDAYRVLGDQEIKKEYDYARQGNVNSAFGQGTSQQSKAYQNMGFNYQYQKTRKYGPGFGPSENFYKQYNAQNKYSNYQHQDSYFYNEFKKNMYTDFDKKGFNKQQREQFERDFYNQSYEQDLEYERELMRLQMAQMKRRLMIIGFGIFGFWFFFEVVLFRIMSRGPKEYVVYDNASNTMYVTDEMTYKALQEKNMMRTDQPSTPRRTYNSRYQQGLE